jgi:hypothetical protein
MRNRTATSMLHSVAIRAKSSRGVHLPIHFSTRSFSSAMTLASQSYYIRTYVLCQGNFSFFQTWRLLCAAAIVVNARLASHSFAATQALNGKATDLTERCLM